MCDSASDYKGQHLDDDDDDHDHDDDCDDASVMLNAAVMIMIMMKMMMKMMMMMVMMIVVMMMGHGHGVDENDDARATSSHCQDMFLATISVGFAFRNSHFEDGSRLHACNFTRDLFVE